MLLLVAPIGCRSRPHPPDAAPSSAAGRDAAPAVDGPAGSAAASARFAEEVRDPEVRRALAELGIRDAQGGRILGLSAAVAPSLGPSQQVYLVGVGGLVVLATARDGGAARGDCPRVVAQASLGDMALDSAIALVAVQAVPDPAHELLVEGFRGGSGGGELTMSLWKLGPGGLRRIWHGSRGRVRFLDGGRLEHRAAPKGADAGTADAAEPARFRWDASTFRFVPEGSPTR